MADSTPPQSSDPEATASAPPSSGDEADRSTNGVPSARLSLIELDLEFDAEESVPGKKAPTHPPPPAKRGSSPPKEDGRKLPEPAFRSQVPKPVPAIKQSMVPPRKFPPETVGDVMTRKLIALTDTDTIENIGTGMQRFRFRHLPVVTEGNRLIGLVTHRDMMRAQAEAGAKTEDGKGGLPQDTPVTAVMNRDILTTRPGTDLVTAGKAMLQQKIGCLPIILDDETLVGMITEADFVKLVVQLLEKKPSEG